MKAVFSLVHLEGFSDEHDSIVYEMFKVSMCFARDLGYEVVLFSTNKTRYKLNGFFDFWYSTDKLIFFMYDDIKIHIWNTFTTNDYFTIDGDLFLFKHLRFGSIFDTKDTTNDLVISVEEFDKSPHDMVLPSLTHFINRGIKHVVPEWDTFSTRSCNTGIVKWHDGSESFRNFYIETYMRLRTWYMDNINYMNQNNLLATNRSISSHFICEHLLYNLIKFYRKDYETLYKNNLNFYSHWKGHKKFTDDRLKSGIHILANAISSQEYKAKYLTNSPISIYRGLVKDGMFPFFNLDT